MQPIEKRFANIVVPAALLGTALWLGAGCPKPEPVFAVTGLSYQEYSDQFVIEACALFERCDRENPWPECRQVWGQEDDEGIIAGIQAGRVTYDRDAAASCIAGFHDLQCADAYFNRSVIVALEVEVPVCQDVFQGTVPLAGACYSPVDCAGDDTFCDKPDGCSGTCRAFVADGATCSPGIAVPFAERCRLDGSFCDPVDSICKPIHADGTACTDDVECRWGHGCVDGVCGAPPPVQTGEACLAAFQCPPNDLCRSETGPGGPYTCVTRVGEGASCTTDQSSVPACEAGLSCFDTGGGLLCHAQQALGGRCETDSNCTEGWCDSTCVPPRAEGEPCGVEDPYGTRHCQPGNFCSDDGTCTALLPDGEPCTNFTQCRSGDCSILGVCGAPDLPPACVIPT